MVLIPPITKRLKSVVQVVERVNINLNETKLLDDKNEQRQMVDKFLNNWQQVVQRFRNVDKLHVHYGHPGQNNAWFIRVDNRSLFLFNSKVTYLTNKTIPNDQNRWIKGTFMGCERNSNTYRILPDGGNKVDHLAYDLKSL